MNWGAPLIQDTASDRHDRHAAAPPSTCLTRAPPWSRLRGGMPSTTEALEHAKKHQGNPLANLWGSIPFGEMPCPFLPHHRRHTDSCHDAMPRTFPLCNRCTFLLALHRVCAGGKFSSVFLLWLSLHRVCVRGRSRSVFLPRVPL